MEALYISFLFILVAFNLLLTLFVYKHKYFESYKKFAMLVLIWCIPIIGLIWVWIMLRTDDDKNGNNNDPLMYGWFDGNSDRNGDSSDSGGD